MYIYISAGPGAGPAAPRGDGLRRPRTLRGGPPMCVYIYIYIYICVCVDVCMYMYVCIYIYIYMFFVEICFYC